MDTLTRSFELDDDCDEVLVPDVTPDVMAPVLDGYEGVGV